MKSAKIVSIAASLLISLSSTFAVAGQKAPVSPIKAATIMIQSILERGARERSHSAELHQLLQIELAKINTYLEQNPLSRPRAIELRELVVLVSKTVFNHQIEHNLHLVNNATTAEQIHNLVVLSKNEVGQSTGNRRLDREFNNRMIGLAKVFHGQGTNKTADVFAGLKVEHNHTVQIPAPRRSMLDAVREAAVRSFRMVLPAPLTPEQRAEKAAKRLAQDALFENVELPQPTLELTEEMIVVDQVNAEIAAQAVENSIVGGSGPRTLHPETDRLGKVTARMGNRSPWCDGLLSSELGRDIF